MNMRSLMYFALLSSSVVMGMAINIDEASDSHANDSKTTKDLFQTLDVDGNGVLTYEEFRKVYAEASSLGRASLERANPAGSFVAVDEHGTLTVEPKTDPDGKITDVQKFCDYCYTKTECKPKNCPRLCVECPGYGE